MNCGSVVAESKDVVDECPVINGNSSIAQRLAALQKSGQLDWKKRISRIAPEKTASPIINITETQELLKQELTNGFRNKITSETRDEEKKDSSLAERLEKLETSRQTWKNRIEPSDAVQFSVAGKMATTLSATPKLSPVSSPLSERKKRTPCPSRFRSFREQRKDVFSDPTSSPKSKFNPPICRSNSLPSDAADEGNETVEKNENNSVVNVPQIFDEEFTTFFGNVDSLLNVDNIAELSSDFSDIKIEGPRLLPAHKKVKAQRKHATTGNPLKTRATKIEIKNEYREVKSNIAEREIKRMNVEKLAKNSSLAVEVLAGLASKEDFQAVQLKKAAPLSSPMLPYKPLMLLHVKGRRHVQTRLVKPCFESINSGDSFVLVTPNEVYHWIGQFSNVIERSRGAEIAQHIVSTHDLGCTSAAHVETIVEDSAKCNSKTTDTFWRLLGATTEQLTIVKAAGSGHPDEDEVYESSLVSTNMIYEAKEDELVPVDMYWASIPKIQMLDPNKVLVFDFGSELYVWMGKNVNLKLRKSSVRLAKELWDSGFNYEECDLCPISSAITVGDRPDISEEDKKKGKERPDWCLFAKVTQHMETVLFREKFLDWPDFSRVIRAKGKDEDTEKQVDSSLDINPCCVKTMLETEIVEADLVLEGSHLGRGTKYFDEERKLYYIISTTDVRMWHVAEFESEEVAPESLGQFYGTNSYVIRWLYSISYTGRELSGLPSKHTTMGRDRCVYFCWQGKNASLNEKGAAALLTVELDEEKGVQLRISQGFEPPAFFNLFDGRTIIYKKRANENDKEWRLFICRGEIQSEAVLLEVSCNIKQLRSRASFILLNIRTRVLYMWHGCGVIKEAVKVCQYAVNRLSDKTPTELNLHPGVSIKVQEINEGSEPKEFFSGLGGSNRKLYMSLLGCNVVYDTTPLLFNLSANSGTFCATPIWPPCRHKDLITAYPFLQEDLYSASQPALFLLDSGRELWVWQGWWPEREIQTDGEAAVVGEDSQNLDNLRGSASVRWQAERRAAMQTALDYWKLKYPDKPIRAFLVWAGLEPIHFTNLFPDWDDRDDVAEINISDGRKPGEMLDVEQELERLTQSTYPIEQLLQRPLPDGVDPTKLELYLSNSHFKEILNVTKEEFAALPAWKQTNMKKNAGLF